MRAAVRIVLSLCLLAAAPLAAQETCLVCVGNDIGAAAGGSSGPAGQGGDGGGGAVERAELESTLTSLGFNFLVTADPSQEICQVALSYPGCGSCFSAPPLGWVQDGNGYVQISDWGPGFQPNTFLAVTEGSPHTVDIVDASHEITQGVPSSWTTFGFWRYGFDIEDYIGWVTDGGDPNLASIDSNDRGLSARPEGSGRLAYIGWNVYGSAATGDDLTILRQAIEWAGQCVVPVELESVSVE